MDRVSPVASVCLQMAHAPPGLPASPRSARAAAGTASCAARPARSLGNGPADRPGRWRSGGTCPGEARRGKCGTASPPLVPVGRLGLPPVRQRSQLAPHVPLPVVARAQPLADVLPRATGELTPPGLRGRAGMDAARGPRARISVALPPLVVHGAPPSRAHAYGAVAVLDSAGEFVHADSPEMMCPNQKEAP